MWEVIIAALIGAAATIIAAWIGTRRVHHPTLPIPPRDDPPHSPEPDTVDTPPPARPVTGPAVPPPSLTSDNPPQTALASDRAAFLREVGRYAGARVQGAYERVLDDL